MAIVCGGSIRVSWRGDGPRACGHRAHARRAGNVRKCIQARRAVRWWCVGGAQSRQRRNGRNGYRAWWGDATSRVTASANPMPVHIGPNSQMSC